LSILDGLKDFSMKKKVIIVGGGFGGLAAAKALSKLDSLEILLIDRRNFHLFQPLLYQIAMAGLNPADISVALRSIFKNKKNVKIILAEVDQIDCFRKSIHFDQRTEAYDYLILSCGVKHSYFGKNHWEELAPGLKNIEQATEIRRRILTAFELAEKTNDPKEQEKYLRFVVVGGGPTGVELAGAIMEMATQTLKRNFQNADLSKTRVILVEAGSRILAGFPEVLSHKAHQTLTKLGVEIFTNTRADELSEHGLKIGNQFVTAKTILWAAGVRASSLTDQLPGEKDSQGKIFVNSDTSLPGFPEVFIIGDQAAFKNSEGKTLPGIAPVAMQQGQFLKKVIQADRDKKPRPNFEYKDKGMMATIGRSKAVAHIFGYNFSGIFAWLAWVFIHVLYLMSFKSRFFVLLQWAWAYFTFGRGARLITYKTWRFYSGEKIKIDS
jgi:NADH:ubiquinone reductase (H+-translocating)